ncbi:MAG TPA: zinc ribbon domain-containing protein [Thermodesulfobacteriota bacterium]|nr:zinc ribbon domain-containing protein [Thermodesulfobacteriota bacterium]
MPIYEFYCKKCNTVYKFYSRTIDTSTIPKCPRCKRVRLERMFSSFATPSKRGGEDIPEAGMPDIDESKLERAMAMLEKETRGMDENDPAQAADLMRKLTDAAGISLGEGMEEALSRMEKGEDPDKIEEELGDLLGEESFSFDSKKKKGTKKTSLRPRVDETLYEL